MRPSWLWIALLTGDWRNLLFPPGRSVMHTLSFIVVQKLDPVTCADQAERNYAILVKAIRA